MVTQIVGILNLTPDSFSDGGKFFSVEAAILQTKKMIADGADVIDIGAESTRPGAAKISAAEEWQRLEKILPAVMSEVKKSAKKIPVSIDSYHFETIQKAHELGVEIVNDVSGLVDEKIIEFVAAKNLKVILMHNLAIHANPDLIVNRELNVCDEILRWAEEKISYLEQRSVKKSQLIFDPGIGFAKDAKQSIRIVKNIATFRTLGLPLYVGHSKKSFLDSWGQKSQESRAQKTLLLSSYLMSKNVEFMRVHDVKEHKALQKI
jgi:dihydropteroate synthase